MPSLLKFPSYKANPIYLENGALLGTASSYSLHAPPPRRVKLFAIFVINSFEVQYLNFT